MDFCILNFNWFYLAKNEMKLKTRRKSQSKLFKFPLHLIISFHWQIEKINKKKAKGF